MSEELVFNGVCPVCGDEFTAPAQYSIETNHSYNGTVCILPRDKWKNQDEPGF